MIDNLEKFKKNLKKEVGYNAVFGAMCKMP
jgi:hypothetical protein